MARQQTTLVPYVFDPRPAAKRGKRVNPSPTFTPGQRQSAVGGSAHGGGGPENKGAMSSTQAGIPFNQSQPSWRWDFDNDFFGPAAPSTKPQIVATAAQPANSFRLLGDAHGGRQ